MFFTNVEVVNVIKVQGKHIHVLTGFNDQLKINTCLVFNSLVVEGETLAHAIIFYKPYWDEMHEETKTFVINHEIGHIMHKHQLTPTRMFVNELEADAYAVANGTHPLVAINVLTGIFNNIPYYAMPWIFRILTRFECWIRIKSLEKLVKKYSITLTA